MTRVVYATFYKVQGIENGPFQLKLNNSLSDYQHLFMCPALRMIVLMGARVLAYPSYEGATYFTNTWIVEVPGGMEIAKSVAVESGFSFGSPVWLFENHFILVRRDYPPRHKRGNPFLTELLTRNKEVKWAEQQYTRPRAKKAFGDINLIHPDQNDAPKADTVEQSQHGSYFGNLLKNVMSFFSLEDNVERKEIMSKYNHYFNDPLWKKQWYAHHSSEDRGGPVEGMDLLDVYRLNITGQGIRVAIVDDGVDVLHSDLLQNYDPEYSYNLNERRSDPRPVYNVDGTTTFKHGTKCAGVVGMTANNQRCGVGVAYNAKLAVITMLEQPGVDVVEGQALQYKCEGVDIYSNSWGPGDNGRIMENMGSLSSKAIEKCLQNGRNGKGSLYLFPAGNGKSRGDNCGADAYSNSIHSVTVASAAREGRVTRYSERCSAIFTTTYSSGHPDKQKVVTTDQNNLCHNRFSGTSAAVPIASGIVALTLEANGNLTYRDVKHLIVMSSEVAPLADNYGTWSRNGAGFWISLDFGFGMINARRMVDLAKVWTSVPERRNCSVSVYFSKAQEVHPGQYVETLFDTSACKETDREVRFLEQIQVIPFVSYGCRGAISIHLTSPTGTTSTLIEPRPQDVSPRGLNGWPLKSVHFWGEHPSGVWMLQTKIHNLHSFQDSNGLVKGFVLILYGTYEKPLHYNDLPRPYSPFSLPETA